MDVCNCLVRFSIAVSISNVLILRGLMMMDWPASKRVNLFQLIYRLNNGVLSILLFYVGTPET